MQEGYEEDYRTYLEYMRLLNQYVRRDVLSRRVAKKNPGSGCAAGCERGARQIMTSSERAKVNVRQGASALVSILVSWLAFCLDTRSDACGPCMGGRARRFSQLLPVDDRP